MPSHFWRSGVLPSFLASLSALPQQAAAAVAPSEDIDTNVVYAALHNLVNGSSSLLSQFVFRVTGDERFLYNYRDAAHEFAKCGADILDDSFNTDNRNSDTLYNYEEDNSGYTKDFVAKLLRYPLETSHNLTNKATAAISSTSDCMTQALKNDTEARKSETMQSVIIIAAVISAIILCCYLCCLGGWLGNRYGCPPSRNRDRRSNDTPLLEMS